MEQKTLTFTQRVETRKGPAGRLRRAGKIPSVIYGSHQAKSITIDAREFSSKFRDVSESTIITLEADGESHQVLVKDHQTDVLSGKILHIDFYEIEAGRSLRTHVPIHLSGTPIGVREGGLLETLNHEIEVECLPKDLPPHIELDISGLAVGDSIHVEDLPQIEGVRFLDSGDQVVCTIVTKRAEEEEVAAEGEIEEGAIAGEEEGDEEEQE